MREFEAGTMSQKVWVIDDIPEKHVSPSRISHGNIPAFQQKSTKQKHPSVAYSLSMIIWGCGQFYNKQWKTGIIFLLFMIVFHLLMSVVVICWETVLSSFESIHVHTSGTLIISGFFYLSGLIFWQFNAWQAYFKSIKINAQPPRGVRMTVLPAMCSLVMPGWGQILNGQIKKAIFFQLFALTGLATFPFIIIIFLLWPALEASRSRLIVEWVFSISIILSPFILIMWMLNIFDAALVSMNNTKKEPLLIRIKYAVNRFRYHTQLYGWKNALLPLIKRTIMIVLLLIFCFITHRSVP
ncbi:MAG: hypothetical protein JSU90_06425, partial [Nitrospiraceae bacterium]